CFKHKKGMVDHASIKPAKKSKSMSIHHGFRFKEIIPQNSFNLINISLISYENELFPSKNPKIRCLFANRFNLKEHPNK
ncbi:hypothetical protein, partial [Anoxybacillus pushchinoensis]|uniref:hypothetical protein n=1 Tax=Anoxybacillus pushchinoensis TaxID=150248 RepID=UPI001ABFED22